MHLFSFSHPTAFSFLRGKNETNELKRENVTPGISLPNWDDFDCEPHGFPRSISQIKLVSFDCSFSIVRVSD